MGEGSLELSTAAYKQGSSSSRKVSGSRQRRSPAHLVFRGEVSSCEGKTEHSTLKGNVQAVSLKMWMCFEIKPPKSRQGGTECSMAMQLIGLLERVAAFLSV